MRTLLRIMELAGVLVLLGACTDTPTHPLADRTPPPHGTTFSGDELQGCVVDGVCLLPPIGSGGGGGDWCDPRVTDCGDGGWDTCITNVPGVSDPEMAHVTSCPGGGGSGPGGDGGGDDGSSDDEECDPYIHPNCERPLTASDTAAIWRALRTMLRPQSQFTDTTAARACGEMEGWFRSAVAAGDVFRGGFDSDTTNDPNGEHYGMYDPATANIHFDPRGLDAAAAGNAAALLEVAITALHEGAHWGGKLHPVAPTFDSAGRDYYTDSPFNHLNPGPNSCVPR